MTDNAAMKISANVYLISFPFLFIFFKMIPVFSLHRNEHSIINPHTVAAYFNLSTANQGTATVCDYTTRLT